MGYIRRVFQCTAFNPFTLCCTLKCVLDLAFDSLRNINLADEIQIAVLMTFVLRTTSVRQSVVKSYRVS